MPSFDISRRYPDRDELDDLEFTSDDFVQWQHLHSDPLFGLPRANEWILKEYLYWRDLAQVPDYFAWQYDYLLPEHNVVFYLHVGGGELAPSPEQRDFFREFIARFGDFKEACDKRLQELEHRSRTVIPNDSRTSIEMTLEMPVEGKVGWLVNFNSVIAQDLFCYARGRGQEITLLEFGGG